MRLNFNFGTDRTIAQNLYQVILINETGFNKIFGSNNAPIVLFCQVLQNINVYRLKLFSVDVFKTKLGNTALKGHLTTFKTNLSGITRAGFGPFMTTGRGDRKSTRLNSSHVRISYAVFC